jgi:hypothetical protein
MSNELAISGVTAVLQYYLNNAYSESGSPFTQPPTVSCLAPDLVQAAITNNGDSENQVNLFLHQVTHNAAWRNVELPSLAADGMTRLSSPPLALDLHYLLTVYGSTYWQAEALLGYAVMMLHESPVLVRSDISNALSNLSTPFPGNLLTPYLGSSGLADQIELIKITPETLGREEMAWLWTALKADYRPTFPFMVSVVLMQPQQQTNLAPPVLHRTVRAQPIQPAVILELNPNGGQVASTETVTVTGEFLSAINQVTLSNPRYGIQYSLPVTATGTSFSFVPNATLAYPAGVYTLTAQSTDASGAILQSTNSLPLAITPTLPSQAANVTSNAAGQLVTITIFSPNALEGQEISLALSSTVPPPPLTQLFSMAAPAQPFTGSVSSLSFQFPSSLPSGQLLGRLIVDGVASAVIVDWSVHPPKFTGPMVTV